MHDLEGEKRPNRIKSYLDSDEINLFIHEIQ